MSLMSSKREHGETPKVSSLAECRSALYLVRETVRSFLVTSGMKSRHELRILLISFLLLLDGVNEVRVRGESSEIKNRSVLIKSRPSWREQTFFFLSFRTRTSPIAFPRVGRCKKTKFNK